MKNILFKFLVLLTALVVAPGGLLAQPVALLNNQTPTIGFTPGHCVGIASNGAVTDFACSPGPATSAVTAAGNGGTITLTSTSARQQNITGTLGQTFKLPDATLLQIGDAFYFNNNGSAGTVTVQNAGAGALTTVPITGYTKITLLANSTANGTWDNHAWGPSNATWGSNALNISGNFVIQNLSGNTLTLDTSHNAQLVGTLSVNGATIGSNSLAVTGPAAFSGAISIGNTVNTVSPTSPNRTITIVIGGTTYYIAAKTTND